MNFNFYGFIIFIYLLTILIVGRILVYNDLFRREIPNKKELRGYNCEDITFVTSEGLTIHGWFVKSEENPTKKTLILLHESHSTRTQLLAHIKFFVNSGFHVLAYDQRSHGASDSGLITFGNKEGEDLIDAISYLKSRDDVDLNKLGAIGFSLGSSGLIYAEAKSKTPLFKALVLEGAFADSYDVGLYMVQVKIGKVLSLAIGWFIFTVGTQLWTLGKFHHSRPADLIGRISTPIMIIRGQNDHISPEFSAKRLIEAVKEPKEIWITPQGGHTTTLDVYPEAYEKRVIGFFTQYLK